MLTLRRTLLPLLAAVTYATSATAQADTVSADFATSDGVRIHY